MLSSAYNFMLQNDFVNAKEVCYNYLQKINKVRYERGKYFECSAIFEKLLEVPTFEEFQLQRVASCCENRKVQKLKLVTVSNTLKTLQESISNVLKSSNQSCPTCKKIFNCPFFNLIHHQKNKRN